MADKADIVERLRADAAWLQSAKHVSDEVIKAGLLMEHAADEIERLREQLAYYGKLHQNEHARLTAEITRLRAQASPSAPLSKGRVAVTSPVQSGHCSCRGSPRKPSPAGR